MAYVITQRCCNDASCVVECPVDCIRPRPEDPGFATAEMLHIDPQTCIDCGACVEACPVDAIYAEDELPTRLARYAEINAAYFDSNPLETTLTAIESPQRIPTAPEPLRVAIVGTGPAACYAAENLLSRGAVEIDMFDRLPAPWGLARYGVAPDHSETRGVTEMFASAFKRDAVRFHLNVEVGKDISHTELLQHCHAVIYAVGASDNRRLEVPGEDITGCWSATEFVAWYNGHPDYADYTFDLSAHRAVIVGNGNVALDVARILTTDPDLLATTDIADHALKALRHSNIREVVLLGRRTLADAAFSGPEFLALGHLPDTAIVVDPADIDEHVRAAIEDPDTDPALRLKLTLAAEYADRKQHGDKRIVFRFLTSPTAVVGDSHVTGIGCVRNEIRHTPTGQRVVPTSDFDSISTPLVLRAIGYRGTPMPDIPFDETAGVIPNDHGRVLGPSGSPIPATYVTGWVKRGPRGVIGSNRRDAQDTVDALVDDLAAGRLQAPSQDRDALSALLIQRCPDLIDRAGWSAIDQAERAAGASSGRVRAKFTHINAMIEAARG